MDNNIVKKELKSLKKENKLLTFVRNINQYNFIQCDYKKLKPFTYTIVIKNTKVITNIKCKGKESFINLKRGDYVLCGPKNEKIWITFRKSIRYL